MFAAHTCAHMKQRRRGRAIKRWHTSYKLPGAPKNNTATIFFFRYLLPTLLPSPQIVVYASISRCKHQFVCIAVNSGGMCVESQ